jgi:hypothetical protein
MEFKAFFLALLFLSLVVPALAIDENTKVTVVYSGATPIKDAISAKVAPTELLLKTATVTAMSAEKYPLAISPLVTIEKWRCTDIKCAYWISAVDPKGNTKAVNNPIWLVNGNAPYHILVSEVEDTKTNTITLTVKEDVKTAIFNILSDYAGRCPIGKPTTGTPL